MRRRAFLLAVCVLAAGVPLHGQSNLVALNDAGWKAVSNGDGARAEALFNEALVYRPNDPVLLFGAGNAAHLRGRNGDALALLKRAVKADPTLIDAAKLLGEIAYRENELELAIRTFEAALKHAPKDAELIKSLAVWRADASTHERFEERRYDRFRVMFEGRAEESLAAQATSVLNSAFWRIGNTLGAFPANPIVAVLYTEQQFRDITDAPEWSGGLYDGRIRIPAAGAQTARDSFERVLTHELTHAMVDAIAPRGVPNWLNEGLAQYFEGKDPAAAAQRVKRSGAVVPLRALERGGFGRFSSAEARVAYDASLAAVGVLFERTSFGWSHLLRALNDGQPFERAIVSFGFSYDDLEKAFTK